MSSEEGPKIYTPFFRRFTDERAQDIRETRRLYDSVRARYLSSPYAKEKAIKEATLTFMYEKLEFVDESIWIGFCFAIANILGMEESIYGFPEDLNIDHISMKEQVDLNHYLRAKDYFFAHEEKITESLWGAIELIFTHVANQLPRSFAPSPFIIPLVFSLPDPKKTITDIIGTLWRDEYKNNALFVQLTRQLHFNLCEVSGIADPYEPKKPLVLPNKCNAPLAEIVDDYLKDTPFHTFFNEPLPLHLTHEDRFSHMHVVGGSGAGKTQLLQNLILHDLTSEDRPALIVVDSQGDLIRNILKLDLPFDPILISPRDTKYPPALNVFDVKRAGEYDEATQEQVTAGVIQTFDYLFAGLFGADLSAKQGVFFKFVARLMLAIPRTMGRNATIMDMLALMEDASPYQKTIEQLPPIQRRFFERDFQGKTFTQTKEQIRYRLQSILENPTLARLFTSSETKIDLFTELNQRSLILVDTAKDFLKGSSGHFGCIFISLALQAALERAAIPEPERVPAFLIVDEAAQYFDSNIDDLLTEARKYKFGCVFAHQYLDQCTSQLRASLNANTSIKMIGSPSTSDARVMAAEMRTTPDFILSQPKLHFAAHIRNVTPQAVSIPVEYGKLEEYPRRDDFDLLMARNRERVSSGVLTQPTEKVGDYAQDVGTGLDEG